MRREISRIWLSFIDAGAVRSLLSIVIVTSAWLRAGRLPEPAKITASMSAARSDLCEVSPIAQRSASTRLDLPQPFGPTTPVRPGSITKSVGSTNDLKPWRRRRVSFINLAFSVGGARIFLARQYHRRHSGWGRCGRPGAVKAATMAAPRAQGNQAEALFPRLLRGLWNAPIPVEESALEKRVDLLLKLLDRGFTLDLVAVDEEGRRRIDLQHLAR